MATRNLLKISTLFQYIIFLSKDELNAMVSMNFAAIIVLAVQPVSFAAVVDPTNASINVPPLPPPQPPPPKANIDDAGAGSGCAQTKAT